MSDRVTLVLDIRSYWLHARGEGGGADFDLVMETDEAGFPLLRGRHVAGLLRLALERAERWGWFEDERKQPAIAALIAEIVADKDDASTAITELLMGARAGRRGKAAGGPAAGGPSENVESIPGCLAVGSALVPDPVRATLRGGKPTLDGATKAALLRRIDSTAIDETLGVAKEKHLRSVEAAIPLPLAFTVEFAPDDLRSWFRGGRTGLAAVDLASQRWQDWLGIAWPALDEVGAKRTRGFGRLAYVPFGKATVR
jgi:hypothetical protein